MIFGSGGRYEGGLSRWPNSITMPSFTLHSYPRFSIQAQYYEAGCDIRFSNAPNGLLARFMSRHGHITERITNVKRTENLTRTTHVSPILHKSIT